MRTPSRPASPHRAPPLLGGVLVVLCLLLAAPAALATGGTVRVTGQTANTAYKFGRAACDAGTTVTFNWDFTAAANPYNSTYSLLAWTTTGSTCTYPATADQSQTVTAGATGTSQPVLLSLFLAASTTCDSSVTSASSPGLANFCIGYAINTTASGSLAEVATAQVKYAMVDPPAPTGLSVAAGDSLLRVSWTAGTDIDHYQIFVIEDPAGLDGGTSDAGVDDGGTSDAGADDGGSDAGADGGSDAGSDGGSDAGTVDYFAGLSPVVSPTSAGTTIVDHTSTGAALVNKHHYLVAMRQVDSYGNTSPATGSAGGTPTPIDDFYDYYRAKGGTADGGGGCGAAGAGWTAAVLFLGWLAARRRRGHNSKSSAALLTFALLTGAAAAALADEPKPAIGAPTSSGEKPARPSPDPADLGPQFKVLGKPDRVARKLLFAVKLDRYDPQVDSQPGLTGTPYHDIFRTRIPLRVQGEISWAFLHRPWLGSLLVGGTFGFWQNIGRGRYSTAFTDSNAVDHKAGDPSDDTALLDIWPLGAVATWRLDQFADRYRWFPLVPYAQAGLSTALWASYNGAGKISNGTDTKPGHGSGWTYGWTAAVGVGLALDAIDPMLSNEAYVDLGLQRTSLFAEYAWTRLDDFAGGNALILSDRQWRFGLALEF